MSSVVFEIEVCFRGFEREGVDFFSGKWRLVREVIK